jgi:hypothetical protein
MKRRAAPKDRHQVAEEATARTLAPRGPTTLNWLIYAYVHKPYGFSAVERGALKRLCKAGLLEADPSTPAVYRRFRITADGEERLQNAVHGV